MSELADPRFVPLLQRPDWAGRGRCVMRPLSTVVATHMPLLSWGLDAGSEVHYLTIARAAELKVSKVELERQSQLHLVKREGRPVGWASSAWQGTQLLDHGGDDHCATDVLDPRLLLAATEVLHTPQLAVAMPERRHLYAVPASFAAALANFANARWGEATRAKRGPLSPQVLLVESTRITGAVPLGQLPVARQPTPSPEFDEVNWRRPRPELRSDVGGKLLLLDMHLSDDNVEAALRFEYAQWAPRVAATAGCNGVLWMRVEGPSASAAARFEALSEDLTNDANRRGWKSPSGQGIYVKISGH